MNPDFWLRRWQTKDIGWHEGRTNAALARHWPSLKLAAGARVFVPLCGKSADMTWLAAQGHRVVGVELSDIAVREFFAGHGLTPKCESRDGFEISVAGSIEIWCGDLFQLQAQQLVDIAGVYDRASLVAMPPTMQPAYAAKMAEVVPRGIPILLVTFATCETQPAGPPFATPPARVHDLYGRDFDIAEIERSTSTEVTPGMRERGVAQIAQSVLVLRRR